MIPNMAAPPPHKTLRRFTEQCSLSTFIVVLQRYPTCTNLCLHPRRQVSVTVGVNRLSKWRRGCYRCRTYEQPPARTDGPLDRAIGGSRHKAVSCLARFGCDPTRRLLPKKAQALFAYLALPAGRSHRRDKLAGLLWSDRGDADARHSLRQALSLITKAMRSGPWGATAMSIEADAIAIEPAAIEVDATRLEGLVADGSPEALLEAVGLWHGDLLDGLNLQAQPFEEWLLGQRARYHELAVEAHRLLLEHQMREGREQQS